MALVPAAAASELALATPAPTAFLRLKRNDYEMMADPNFATVLMDTAAALDLLRLVRSGEHRFKVLMNRGVRRSFDCAVRDLGAEEFNLDMWYHDNVSDSVKLATGAADLADVQVLAAGGIEDASDTTDWVEKLRAMEREYPGFVALLGSSIDQENRIHDRRRQQYQRAAQLLGGGPQRYMGPSLRQGASARGFGR